MMTDVALTLRDRINEAHRSACRDAVAAMNHAIECGRLLAEAKQGVPHGQWLPWIAANCEFSERQARRYIQAAKRTLRPISSEAEAADLGRRIWGNGQPMAYLVSSSNEWYTPRRYIEAARSAMGNIDLDPASNPTAQKWIGATHYFTKADDGLCMAWSGRVWINPPYGDLTARFVDKALREYAAGSVEQCILLLSAHATDRSWFQSLWDFPLCFTDHRIAFQNGDGRTDCSPTFGSVFVYLGRDVVAFERVFREFGAVVSRVRIADTHGAAA